MPDITLVTQSLDTEVTSIPEEFEVLSIESPETLVVEVSSPTTVIDVPAPTIIEIPVTETVVDLQVTEMVVEISTGPLVIPYVPFSEANMPLDVQIDEASSTVTYVGQAAPGTANSDAAWRIKRITDTGSQVSIDWAGGSGEYLQVWDDRAILVYGP